MKAVQTEFNVQQAYTEDQQLIEQIKKGDQKSVVQVYQLHKSGFIHWAQINYKIDEDSAADAFQDAVICLYHNIIKGKLENLTSSLKTYLYAIGKNVVRKKLQQPVMLDKDDIWIVENLWAEPINNFTVNERQQFVAKLMETLGEPCKTLLRLFYFKGYTMESIANTMDYKNENVAKTQKLRCLTTLKSMVKDKFSGDIFLDD